MRKLVPNWNQLSLIGTSKLINLTIFAPFIGYLILFNNELVGYFVLAGELIGVIDATPGLDEEAISRLHFLYYGLIFIGIASMLFSLLCPKEIKNHQTEFSYISDELRVMTYERVAAVANDVKTNHTPDSKQAKQLEDYVSKFNASQKDSINTFKNGSAGMRGDIDIQGAMNEAKSIQTQHFINIMNLNWDYQNNSKIHFRIALSAIYLFGFGLVSIPSISVFIKVLKVTF